MSYYKDPQNRVHHLDDAAFEHLLPPGCVEITEAEATALISPTPLPPPRVVTMRQARLALLQAGLLGTVSAALASAEGAAGEAARIEWEYAATVDRDSPLVVGFAAGLNLTPDQLDALFAAAAGL